VKSSRQSMAIVDFLLNCLLLISLIDNHQYNESYQCHARCVCIAGSQSATTTIVGVDRCSILCRPTRVRHVLTPGECDEKLVTEARRPNFLPCDASSACMGVARIFDWGGGPMYDVVVIVQFLPRYALQSKARSC